MPGGTHALLAVSCQWQFCCAGVFSRQRPLRLTVAHDEAAWRCRSHRGSYGTAACFLNDEIGVRRFKVGMR